MFIPTSAQALSLPLGGGGSTPPAGPFYVALGDSYSSAPGNVTRTDGPCARFAEAHPTLTGAALGLKTYNYGCAGATVKKGIMGQQVRNTTVVSPQINNLKASAKPELITITIGLNDITYNKFYQKCFTDTCGTATDTANFDAYLATVKDNIRTIYAKIQSTYGATAPKTIILGYPNIFPPEVYNCASMNGMTADEVTWVRDVMTGHLNQAISETAAGYSFVHYVPVNNLVGHEVCTADPWVFSSTDVGNLHPNAKGHQAMSNAVVSAYAQLR
jgi:lysophospholipase L1-like esterase